MECYCNCLKDAIRNQWSLYATIDWYILEDAQLTQLKAIYNLTDELALWLHQTDPSLRAYQSFYCKFLCSCLFCHLDLIYLIEDLTCILLCPHVIV